MNKISLQEEKCCEGIYWNEIKLRCESNYFIVFDCKIKYNN